MSDNVLVLGYWDLRGIAAPIRMALSYGGVPFKDELYSLTRDGDKWTTTWWAASKAMCDSGECVIPNLPFLRIPAGVEGGPCTIVQSIPILQYAGALGKCNGGPSALDMAKVSSIVSQAADFRSELNGVSYTRMLGSTPVTPEMLQGRIKTLCESSMPYYFSTFDAWLAALKTPAPRWYVGTTPTIADFAAFDIIDTAQLMLFGGNHSTEAEWKAKYPHLAAHMDAVRAEPKLQGYFASAASRFPPCNKTALWGNGHL